MMTTTKELKACPFCGGEMEITTGGMGFFFECSECKASWHGGVLTNYATQNKRNFRKLINSAIEKWNSDIRKEVLTMKQKIMNIEVIFDDDNSSVFFNYGGGLEDRLCSKRDIEDCLICLKYTILDAIKEHGFVFDEV